MFDTSKLQYAQMINGIAMVTDFIVFRRPTSCVFNENRAIPLARKITIVIKQDFNHVPLIYYVVGTRRINVNMPVVE